MNKLAKIALGIAIGVLALCGVGVALNSGDEPATPANAAPAAVTSTTTGSTTAAKTTPALTKAQQNAARSAESYLRVSGFSRSGLISQLVFEGYSKADATVAVDSLNIDWNAQAERTAESYLRVSGFSRKGLIEQLKHDGYTAAQAAHGADSVGL